MKRICNLVMCMLVSLCLFTACSSDDESGDGQSSITVDGTSCSIDDATICYSDEIEDSQGEFVIPAHASCVTYLFYDDSLYDFSFSIDEISSDRELKIGENVIDKIDMHSFRPFTSIELSTRYSDEAGSVIVRDVAHGYAVLEFKDFSFVKDNSGRETTYHINGRIKYYDINVD